MKIIRKLTGVFDWLVSLFGALAVILIALNMVMVCTLVFMRYVLKNAPAWVIEVTEYSLLYITFLGTTWLLKEEGHVRMDLIISGFSPKVQAIINTTTSMLCAVICFVVTWYGVKITWDHYQTNYVLPTIIRPQSYLIVGIIPIGCFMLFIQFLRRTYRYFQAFRDPKKNIL